MPKPVLLIVDDEPVDLKPEQTELGFRKKAWNTTVNTFGLILIFFSLLLDSVIILPIGFVFGLFADKYPEWAVYPLTDMFVPNMPGKSEKFYSRPFYRSR